MPTALRFLVLPFLLVLLFATPASANAKADAKAVISKQVALIKAGDVEKLKASFTPRLREKITDAVVKKAADQVATMSIDELVASASGTKSSIKVKMKNGRSLTTLVKVDGAWLADTLWFK